MMKGYEDLPSDLASGARGDVPLVLLANPETSDPILPNVALSDRAFDNRYDFGFYLKDLLAAFELFGYLGRPQSLDVACPFLV